MFYGIGAAYSSGTEDHASTFISKGIACIGWNSKDAPAFHEMLRQINIGDIVFLKSFSPKAGLYIKAIGLVTSSRILQPSETANLGYAREVAWKFHATRQSNWLWLGRLQDKYDFMRGGTMYIEMNPDVQARILAELLK
ncbi:MAG: hypothetical protein IJ177_08095 [Fibrobacter sp.]|uniref:hypothetical protein n=1 Tax=Fibrobacter sp. TaxID=35828 RepID=UPI0025BD1ADA|nr:hypothetical protein [Fibrobacter sp.]MBQ9226132.1 hypothetical protein [Fibrobacter sp.]